MADGFVPPQEVRNNAKRGLELRKKHGRGGTEVGVARARDLSNGKALSLSTIRRMVSYFARHEVDKKGEGWGKDSAGYIAWLLWGGDAGKSWANRISKEQDKKDKANMADFANAYAAIVKMDENADGTLTVYGKATDDTLDIDQQICDPVWLDKAMPEWFVSGGNIREQHSNIAAGVAEEYEKKSDGHYITALVVDPISVKKVKTRVLKGFSIGIKSPRVVKDNKAVNGRIIDGQIVEVSLVDRPANPNAKLVLAKSVESEESLMKVEELMETTTEEKEVVPQSDQMNGETKNIPSREEMVERYAAARKALDEVTRMCKECGYDDIEKQYGESAEEETEEGEAGSGAEHELEEARGKSTSAKCLECGCNQVTNSHGGGTTTLPDGTTANMTTAEMVFEKSITEIIPAPEVEEIGTQIEEEDSADDSAEKSLLADINITDIVEKAVKSAMSAVEAQVAELKSAKEAVENKATQLESELATAKSLAIGGGPKRTTMATGSNKPNEWHAKANLYSAKAAETSDPILAKGYRELAKDFLAKATAPQE